MCQDTEDGRPEPLRGYRLALAFVGAAILAWGILCAIIAGLVALATMGFHVKIG